MRIENGKLIYEAEKCLSCSDGRREKTRSCRYVGRIVKGRFLGNKCPDCGATRQSEHNRWMGTGEFTPCGACNGTLRTPETRYSSIPKSLYPAVLEASPLILVRQKRGATYNEAWLGIGCIMSINDYGTAWKLLDETVLTQARGHFLSDSFIQACHVVGEDDRLPPAIGVFLHTGGYSLRPMTKTALAQLVLEYPESVGRAIGQMVYGQGGNGTLAATGLYR